MIRKVLIIEDDISFGTILEKWFKRNDFEAILVSRIEQARKEFVKNEFDLILTDLRLPDGDGIMFLAWIKEQKMPPPVIVMTSYAEIQSAVSAMKLGAFDYLEKPINHSVLKQKIEEALNTPIQKEKEAIPKDSGFVYGKSEIMNQVHKHIMLVAPTQMSVLIMGESGTGKEYAARLIHENSTRKNAPFIAVDCGSLSKELAPSELFGHLKGSFTSAGADKKGVFEQAGGGTVFLDEIGNLSYEVQVQLLRALQERKIRPVGSATDLKIDIRLIAATNESLDNAIVNGKFREDLYHRLNEFSIIVPPLRERVEDIIIFAHHFLQEANSELGKNVTYITPEATHILEKHNWDGNLRELRNVIRRAVLFAQTNEITVEDLPILSFHIKPFAEPFLGLHLANEREQIETALKQTHGNKTMAAHLLKIDRKTLYNKLHQYGIPL